jgi:hypothetical protein
VSVAPLSVLSLVFSYMPFPRSAHALLLLLLLCPAPPSPPPPGQVALAQKWLIQKARLASRPVLVAGQLMEGMATAPRPSRPEITDVVNAVYDGADGVVLMQVGGCAVKGGGHVS